MTGRGKGILGAESLQVTRENPRNLKEKDGDGQTERVLRVIITQRV